ncbi:MAG TPA: hypothetical protein VK623_00320 [Flavobacterium sp.]|nr:hypothetical protein [Flavobacterium sp.]
MKKRFVIVNFALMLAVLFSISFQSYDAAQHFEKEFSAPKCHHKYGATNQEITHQHHNFEHCPVCDFSFSSFISGETILFKSGISSFLQIPYFLTANKIFLSYPGKTCSLRGPPSFIA